MKSSHSQALSEYKYHSQVLLKRGLNNLIEGYSRPQTEECEQISTCQEANGECKLSCGISELAFPGACVDGCHCCVGGQYVEKIMQCHFCSYFHGILNESDTHLVQKYGDVAS